MLDQQKLQQIKELRGENALSRALEYKRRKGVKEYTVVVTCSGLPRNCFTEEYLASLTATQRVALNVQSPLDNLDELLLQVTPQNILSALQ
jgi:hypothetical protein